MSMHFNPGMPIEVKQGGMVHTGYLKSAELDSGICDNESELTLKINMNGMIPLGSIQCVQPTVQQSSPYPIITKENEMKYNATLIRDKARKRTNVHLEIVGKEDTYLGADGEEHERKMGEEMPLYGTFPDEILGPILAAASSSEFYDRSRQWFRLS